MTEILKNPLNVPMHSVGCVRRNYAGTEKEWQKEFTAEKVHVIVLVAIAMADVSKGIQSRIC